MKRFHLSTLATLLLSAVCSAAEKPNIVIIFIDDMGYADIGPFGNTVNQTPNLDRMAAEGNTLRQFYVSNTACTPSRAALLTGTYAHRIGMDGMVVFPGDARGLNPDEVTIAEMLREIGYTTGIFGKWHLGDQKPFLPLAQGFDHYFGIPYSNDMWPGNERGNPVTDRGPYEPLPIMLQNDAVAYVADEADQSLLAEVITDAAVEFIRENQDQPFFCYVPHSHVHNPRYARPDIMERAEGNVDRATVEEVDDSVGRILDTLRELDIDENTLVIFTSDNGGAGGMSMGPLRGGKGGAKFEGHMRVPTIAWWPGQIEAGVETNEIAVTTDLLPSFAKLTGAKLPSDRTIDGKDVLDIVLGKADAKSPHHVHYYEVDGIRRGYWKMVKVPIKGKGIHNQLFHLGEDLGEQNNIAKEHPALVRELDKLLTKHAESIAKDTRPAAFVDNAKPILTETDELPKLRDYVGKPNTIIASATVASEKMIDLVEAPRKPFEGTIFFLNDWDGGDEDNQNAALELNRNSPIKEGVILLSDLPGRKPKKVQITDLVTESRRLADESRRGPVAIAMGAHSRHALAWLTELSKKDYQYNNIVLVTHSNWNELDGRAGYEANKQPGDPPLADSHGVDLRAGLYPSLAQISDLGVAIWEIPRTDSGPGGWGGRVNDADGIDDVAVKPFDISDLGLIHYLKTGKTTATRKERNALVSEEQQKPASLKSRVETESSPNILLILADDQGWNATSLPADPSLPESGSIWFETPALDRLAQEGMRFSQAYAPAPTCSPTRHSIQWGRSPSHLGIYGADNISKQNIKAKPEDSLANLLKRARPEYVCAHLGKWHVAYDTDELGFPINTGNSKNLKTSPDPKDPKFIFSLTRKANEFMSEQAEKGRPFFLQISHYADHLDYEALPETVSKYEAKMSNATEYHRDPLWAAMNENLDSGIGMVLDKIDELGIRENTYVIYTADNGYEDKFDGSRSIPQRGFYKAFPQRSHKYTVSEGGIRVPFIIRGPDIPANVHSGTIVSGIDIYPTILSMVGAQSAIPQSVEGASLLEHLISGGKKAIQRKQPFLVFKHSKPSPPHDAAILKGDYKWIRSLSSGDGYLYDLRNDIGESMDLSAERPALASKLDKQLMAYLKETGWTPSTLKKKKKQKK
ncbi:MAG: sulfatase-like hydrolase/transferase [Verrucomicrobiota bacterium]